MQITHDIQYSIDQWNHTSEYQASTLVTLLNKLSPWNASPASDDSSMGHTQGLNQLTIN